MPEIEDPQPIPGLPGETVQFRRWATYDDELQLMAEVAEFLEADPDRKAKLAFLPSRRTCLMIAAWSLRDDEGEPLPVEPDNLLGRLPRRATNWLIAEAEKRYEGRPEVEEGPFDGRSPQLSTATT